MKGRNTAYADHAFKLTPSLTFMQNDYYVKVALMSAFYYIQEKQSVWLVTVFREPIFYSVISKIRNYCWEA